MLLSFQRRSLVLLFHPIKGCAPIDYSASGGYATGPTKVKAGRVPMDEDTVPVINVGLLLMGKVTVAEVKPGVTVNIPDMGIELGGLGRRNCRLGCIGNAGQSSS